MSDDDLIRRALGGGRQPEPVDGGLIDGAIARGARLRRRRVWFASGGAACLLAGLGLAVVASAGDDPETVVGVTPTSDAPATTVPVAATHATSTPPAPPASSEPSNTTTTTSSSTTSTSVASVPPTTDAVLPPPTVAPHYECPSEAELGVDSIRFDTSGQAPSRDAGFLAYRHDADFETVGLELWSDSGRAAAITDTVPELDNELWYCPTSPMALGYDGRWIWFWSGGYPNCEDCAVARSQLFRADVVSGELVILWSSNVGHSVLDLVPDGAGGATIVTGPSAAALVLSVESIAADATSEVVASWSVETTAIVAASLQAATGRLAYTATNPSPVNPPGGQWPPQLHVLQIGNSDERVIDLTGHMMFPDLLGWQDGGGWLLIQDIWENTSVAAIDADAPDPLSTFTRLVDYACWMEGGEMAVAGWDSGYGESVPVLGSVQLVDVPGTVLADYGLDVIAGSLACLDGDRVAFAKHPPGGVDEPSTLVIAAPDGTTVELTSDRLSVIQRNGNA